MGKTVRNANVVMSQAFFCLNGETARDRCFPIRLLRVSKRTARKRIREWTEALEEALNVHLCAAWRTDSWTNITGRDQLWLPPEVFATLKAEPGHAVWYESDFGQFKVKRIKYAGASGTCYVRVNALLWPFCEINRQAWAAAAVIAALPL